MKKENFTHCIRFCSLMNLFIDLLLFINEDDVDEAIECLNKGLDDFYDSDSDDGWGSRIEWHLTRKGIPYCIEYGEETPDGMDTTQAWYDYVDEIETSGKFKFEETYYSMSRFFKVVSANNNKKTAREIATQFYKWMLDMEYGSLEDYEKDIEAMAEDFAVMETVVPRMFNLLKELSDQ